MQVSDVSVVSLRALAQLLSALAVGCGGGYGGGYGGGGREEDGGEEGEEEGGRGNAVLRGVERVMEVLVEDGRKVQGVVPGDVYEALVAAAVEAVAR